MIQKAIIWTSLAVAVGVLVYEARQATGLAEQVQALQQRSDPWIDKARELEQERDEATNRLALLTQERAALQACSEELTKLRAATPRLQEVSQKVARFETAGGTIGQLEKMLIRANTPSTNQQQGFIQQAYVDFFSRFRSIAGLNAEQERAVRELLLKQADIQSQIMMGQTKGTLTRERKDQLTQTSSNLDTQIDAIIPADRLAAVKKAIAAAAERDGEVFARISADGELAMFQSCIGTSRDQEERLFPILYELELRKRNGTSVSPEEWFDAVARVLAPAQAEQYRKLIEENHISTMVQIGPK